MTKKLKIILIFLIICLIGVGVFCFLNIQKKENTQIQTTPNLKLLTSHSSPQAGENWVISFETTGASDLIITPADPDSVGDLDFISLTCIGEERTLQILENDAIFYTNWQCAGKGELTHLVNIARKHTLKFQFGDKLAFAYNNPDSVTDTFADEGKIAATSSVTVSSGQVKLSTLKANGESCSSGSECSSTFCINGYCCNTVCSGNCDRCNVAGSLGTCTNVNSDCAGTGASCYCSSGNCQACSNTVSSCNCSGYACQACPDTYGLCGEPTCSSYTCGNTPYANTTDCGTCVKCDGSGSCSNCYGVGTTDSTAPGTCTATHYRCNGSCACTAPCHATATTCISTSMVDCNTWCAFSGYCGCTNAWWDAACAANYAGDCTLEFGYCKCKNYLY